MMKIQIVKMNWTTSRNHLQDCTRCLEKNPQKPKKLLGFILERCLVKMEKMMNIMSNFLLVLSQMELLKSEVRMATTDKESTVAIKL